MFPLNQNSKLEAFLGSSPASNIQWSVGYIDLPPQTDAATEQQRGNTFRSVSNATSDVTICPYPGQKSAASTVTAGQPAWVRNILYVKGYNPNAGAVTATIQINDGNDDIQWTGPIPAGGLVYYEDKKSWLVMDANGNILVSQGLINSSQIVGTTTNDNAAAGRLGEVITATAAAGSVSLTTATPANITSISLTAGDWDVWGMVSYIVTATTNVNQIANSINTTSATLGAFDSLNSIVNVAAGLVYGGSGATLRLDTIPQRVSLSATTTVYLVTSQIFTLSTMTAGGTISARRMR